MFDRFGRSAKVRITILCVLALLHGERLNHPADPSEQDDCEERKRQQPDRQADRMRKVPSESRNSQPRGREKQHPVIWSTTNPATQHEAPVMATATRKTATRSPRGGSFSDFDRWRSIPKLNAKATANAISAVTAQHMWSSHANQLPASQWSKAAVESHTAIVAMKTWAPLRRERPRSAGAAASNVRPVSKVALALMNQRATSVTSSGDCR